MMFKRSKPPAAEAGAGGFSPPRRPEPSAPVERTGGESGDARRVRPVYERLQASRTVSGQQIAPLSESQGARLHVGPGLKMEGKIEDCELLMIEGAVEATVEAKALKIGKSGSFKGKAQSGSAEIHGVFEGELSVTGLLAVGAAGSVTGTLVYGELAVERGGRIVGTMTLDEKAAAGVKRGGAHTLKAFRTPGGEKEAGEDQAAPGGAGKREAKPAS